MSWKKGWKKMDGEASCKGFREDISIGAMPPENGLGLKTDHPQLEVTGEGVSDKNASR